MKFAPLFFLAVAVPALVHAGVAAPSSPLRVALVFDDGPVPGASTQFLELLAREQVHVTFSHEGRFVAAHPELCRAAVAAGHEIANHSYTHPHFKELDAAAIRREILDTQAAVKTATGREPRWLWTPFLEWDDRIAAAVQPTGLKHLPLSHLHLVSSDDWNRATDAAGILRKATTGIRDRTVILCHEWREETLAQLPAILAELRRQGCEFLTFSQLADTLTPEQRAVLR
ncbi:MAG TPA: polysaccharide deacetylase family protein [Opitutus sp.]|nr:polysaccharide deacetylase family protein [Opitutus sp.]